MNDRVQELQDVLLMIDVLPKRHFKEHLRKYLVKRIKELEEGVEKWVRSIN